MSPVEHDERWLELTQELHQAVHRLSGQSDTLMHAAGFRRLYSKYDQSWMGKVHGRETAERVNLQDAKVILVAMGGDYVPQYSRRANEMLLEWDQRSDGVDRARVNLVAHESNYTGWTRYFLVTSSNGLVHKTMSCSTCNKGRSATTFALLPKLSDTPIDTAVASLGAALCSVCFPEAPTEWTDEVKIPARIASLLLTSGPAEFEAELKKYNAKRAAKEAKS